MQKKFGDESWLTCQEHLWLEEDLNGFQLKETSLANNKILTQDNKQTGNLVDIEGIKGNYTGLHELPNT